MEIEFSFSMEIPISSKWGMCIRTTDELLQEIIKNLDSQPDLCPQKKIIDKNNDLLLPTAVDTHNVRTTSFLTNPTNDSNKILSLPSKSHLVTQYNINDSQVKLFCFEILFFFSIDLFSQNFQQESLLKILPMQRFVSVGFIKLLAQQTIQTNHFISKFLLDLRNNSRLLLSQFSLPLRLGVSRQVRLSASFLSVPHPFAVTPEHSKIH
jgi:hypothetical protein